MRSDHNRLPDISEAIERMERYRERGRKEFASNELLQTWVVHHPSHQPGQEGGGVEVGAAGADVDVPGAEEAVDIGWLGSFGHERYSGLTSPLRRIGSSESQQCDLGERTHFPHHIQRLQSSPCLPSSSENSPVP